MKHDLQLSMLDRLIEGHSNRLHQLVSDEILHLPLDPYTSQENFDREMNTVFSNHPLIAGHVDSIREPGSYLLGDWKRYPYIVVRQQDGTLRAFWNTCRHRGSTLVKSEDGKPRRSLVCPFHGWTYGLDGRLQDIPRPFAFPCLDKREYGLKEIPVKESMGIVWVCPKHSGSFDPVAYTGGFADDLNHFGLGKFARYKKVVKETRANWKLLVQIALEEYHVPAMHKATIAKSLKGAILVHDVDLPHLRICLGRNNLLESADVRKEDRNLLDYATVMYIIFPNTIIHHCGSYCWIKNILPLAPDRTLWKVEFLYLPEKFSGEKGQKSLENLFIYFTDVVFDSEDYPVVEGVQANLLNGVNETHTLGREEGLVMLFQDIVNGRMQSTAGD